MKTISLDQYIKQVRAMPDQVEAACIRGLREAAHRGVGHVVSAIEDAKAVNTGGLKQSVRSANIPKGGLISVDAPHAPMVEHGTRPHWPPHDPIFEWVMRKGLADDEEEGEEITFAIRLHIATVGTEPRHFFAKAMKRVERDVEKFIKQELDKL